MEEKDIYGSIDKHDRLHSKFGFVDEKGDVSGSGLRTQAVREFVGWSVIVILLAGVGPYELIVSYEKYLHARAEKTTRELRKMSSRGTAENLPTPMPLSAPD